MFIDEELFPYYVYIEAKDIIKPDEMWKWCKEQWGPCIANEQTVWKTCDQGTYKYKFENKADRDWFILRWS